MRICFVARELFPFHQSEEGRVQHHLVRQAAAAGLDVHVLLSTSHDGVDASADAFTSQSVTIHSVDLGRQVGDDWATAYPPPEAFSDTEYHWQSLRLMLELRRLVFLGLDFARIEFSDRCGLAYAAAQERKLGLAFADATIVVRLYGAQSLEDHHAPMRLYPGRFAVFELERQALLLADLVIAPHAAAADLYQALYEFDNAWRDGVAIERVRPSPPSLDRKLSAQPALYLASEPRPSKRPELFIQAATEIIRTKPDWPGHAFIRTDGDSHYIASLQPLIPADLLHRFAFLDTPPQELAGTVAVLPSSSELLGIDAADAIQGGASVVVHAEAPAFSEGTWSADGAVRRFDGSLDDLVRVLSTALSEGTVPSHAREPSPAAQPQVVWDRPRRSSPPSRRTRTSENSEVSVVITNYNLGEYLPSALESVVRSTHRALDIILVDDASSDTSNHTILERLEATYSNTPNVTLRIIRNVVNRGLAYSRNIGIAAARGAYVLPLDADDMISPTFIELAVAALQAHDEVAVVVPCAAYFREDQDIEQRRFLGHAVFLGEIPVMGLTANGFGCATALFRRPLLQQFKYDDGIASYEDWDLYLRLANAGARFLVTNQVHFFYRYRAHSMVRSVSLAQRFEVVATMYASLRRCGVRLSPSVMAMPHEVALQLAAEQDRSNKLQNQMVELQQSHAELAARSEQLGADCATLHAERQDLVRRYEELDTLRHDLDQRNLALADEVGRIPALETTCTRLGTENAALRHRDRQLQASLTETRRHLVERIDELVAALAIIHQSRSWRVVEAYRRVMDRSVLGSILRPLRNAVLRRS